MKCYDYSSIGERCYEERLDNGLLVRVVPKKDFARKYAFIAIDFGSIDTSFTVEQKRHRVPDGIAHYLEHKMFDLPDANAMNLFAAQGGSPNAFTSYAMTAYYFSCTENFDENLRTLLTMVMTPYFTPESVEKERGIIAQEIKMYEDSADSRVYEDLFAALYAEHPVRVPIAGTVESIGEITAQTLYDCYDAFYQPSNMILCVAGDVDAQQVIAAARELTGSTKAQIPERHYGKTESMLPVKKRTQRRMEVSMPSFSVGFKCEAPASGRETMLQEIIGDLAAEILIGESSPLYQRLYEDGLIDAGFSAGYESVKEACMITAGGDSKDPDAVLSAMLAEADRIRAEGFDTELFERLKKSSLGRRTRDLDSFESICYRNCAYFFDGTDYFRFPEVFASVTKEAVQEFLCRVIRPERSAISMILPKEQEVF